ncbi:TlpA family protein disulfide reductase [Pseudalkalibacillus salsuginis]|uniref:TlpA family protein disulfide reductase n=1 Tax=Pseudalkalibacillus salsuginis TaxID=2910972 RepID=UPI001F2FDE98|nr:TlpA disulfide reductase family protein [Pseudalkalibacillus salsuginis]MCF6411142.1 TlpA family protein disulfide reductase [Pseudalkalibacillus salsuginis]
MQRRIQFIIIAGLVIFLGFLSWRIPSTAEQSKLTVDSMKAAPSLYSAGKSVEAVNVRSTIAEIGKKAPDFTLENLEGEKVSLSDYRGKTVILNFWTTWCTYCKKEIPELINFHHLHEKEDVVILAVNLSSEEENLEQVAMFSKEFEIPFEVPLDKEGTVGQDYQIIVIPTTYIIAPDGIVKNKIMGPVNLDQLEQQLSR